MPRLILVSADCPLPCVHHRTRRAFTLIEILVAMAITLVMMAAVVNIFDRIGTSINDSRATIEMAGRLRGVRNRLQTDLASTTAPLLPWTRPESGVGYFEYVEGFHSDVWVDLNDNGQFDANEPRPTSLTLDPATSLAPTTGLGDYDDVLMFTARSRGEPFVGRFGSDTIESKVAEIIWYAVESDGTTGIAGLRTIYRRVLLIAPWAVANIPPLVLKNSSLAAFHRDYDISARLEGGQIVFNTLGDVTKRENRFWHTQPEFPYALPQIDSNKISFSSAGNIDLSGAGSPNFLTAGFEPGMTITIRHSNQNNVNRRIEAVSNTRITIDPNSGTLNNESAGQGVTIIGYPLLADNRLGEDVMLTNVLAFDVRAYDPGAPLFGVPGTTVTIVAPGDPGYANSSGTPVVYGAFVDLGYVYNNPVIPPVIPLFNLANTHPVARSPSDITLGTTYDTWSFHYEHDGIDQDNFDGDGLPNTGADEGTDGFDNDDANGVDDIGERETSPPYPVPLRGIQVRIRVYEPDSRSIREVSVNQHFVPE